MTSSSIYLGVILMIAIIIIAYFAWRYRTQQAEKSKFYYGTPAAPIVREAAAALFATLNNTVAIGRSFLHRAGEPAEVSDATVRSRVAGARASISQIVQVLDGAEKRLSAAEPSYANYLAVYRGLTGSDAAMLAAADAYVEAGHHVHQLMARTAPGAHDVNLASLGNTLISMGDQMRRTVRAVHQLGSALDLE